MNRLIVGVHVSSVSFGASQLIKFFDSHAMVYDQGRNASELCRIHVACRLDNFQIYHTSLGRLTTEIKEFGGFLGCLSMDLVPWILDHLVELYEDADESLFKEFLEKISAIEVRAIEQQYTSLRERIFQNLSVLDCGLIKAHIDEILVLLQKLQEAIEKIIDWIRRMRLIAAETTPNVTQWQSSCPSLAMASLIGDINFIANGANLKELYRLVRLAIKEIEETVSLRIESVFSTSGKCEAFHRDAERILYTNGGCLYSFILNRSEASTACLAEIIDMQSWLLDSSCLVFTSSQAKRLCRFDATTGDLSELLCLENCSSEPISVSSARGGICVYLATDKRQLCFHYLADIDE